MLGRGSRCSRAGLRDACQDPRGLAQGGRGDIGRTPAGLLKEGAGVSGGGGGLVSESAETVGKVSEVMPRAVRGSRLKAGEPREGLAGRLGAPRVALPMSGAGSRWRGAT